MLLKGRGRGGCASFFAWEVKVFCGKCWWRSFFVLPLQHITEMVHSSSGLGRWPLTPETRVRLPDALQGGVKKNPAFFVDIGLWEGITL